MAKKKSCEGNTIAIAEARALAYEWRAARTLQTAINKKHANRPMESKEEMASTIEEIQIICRRHSMKVLCPKCKCAATIYLHTQNPSKFGAVQYHHYRKGGGNTRHGGKTIIQELTLIPNAALGKDDKIVVTFDQAIEATKQ